MKFYFSIVSHLHHDIICRLDTLRRLAINNDVVVICRDNIKTEKLKNYCSKYKIEYVYNSIEYGFSRNNNLNFWHAKLLGMQSDDYFVLLNPDVFIDTDMIAKFIENLMASKLPLAAPNLYLDSKRTKYDDNLRLYPKLTNFIKNYLFNDRSTVVNKTEPHKISGDYWASGAFLAVTAKLYQKLDGFDESYFLYCEDVDFCRRAYHLGEKVAFLADIEATHYRHRCSQKLFSREFFHHVKSTLLYTTAKRPWRRVKSCLHKPVKVTKKSKRYRA